MQVSKYIIWFVYPVKNTSSLYFVRLGTTQYTVLFSILIKPDRQCIPKIGWNLFSLYPMRYDDRMEREILKELKEIPENIGILHTGATNVRT